LVRSYNNNRIKLEKYITYIVIDVLAFYDSYYTLNFEDNKRHIYHMGYNWKKGQLKNILFKVIDWEIIEMHEHRNKGQLIEIISLNITKMLEFCP